MSINLTILQSFNNAVNSVNRMNDNTRLQNESFNLNGKCTIKQIPANKYDHIANNAVRKNFARALTGAFGVKSLEELPEGVRKSLKIGDYKLDKDGNITSTRPLTARRVRAVMSAIQEVTAKAAPNRQEAEAIRGNFNAYLDNSAYMKAAFDRIAVAEGRKPLSLENTLVSERPFDIPLSALKVYTKGITKSDLASKIDEIKSKIASDVDLAVETLSAIRAGGTLKPNAEAANALRRYFALCAVASDTTGRGVSRTVSVPDDGGRIAAFLKASLKGAGEVESGIVHMNADPFLSESRAMTRFTVDIGFSESAGFSEAWYITYYAYEDFVRTDGFSPLMRRGVEPGMSIAQMYANITAERTRLLNAYSAEMDALLKAHPNLAAAANADNAAPLNFANIPEPFKANLNKNFALRRSLDSFFSSLRFADPIYADNPALRHADETVLTESNIPAIKFNSVRNFSKVEAAANVNVEALYEGLTLEDLITELAEKAPSDFVAPESGRNWAVCALLRELPKSTWGDRDFSGFIADGGKNGVPEGVMDVLQGRDARELYVLKLCALSVASGLQMPIARAGIAPLGGTMIYDRLMSGEIPLNVSVEIIRTLDNTLDKMDPDEYEVPDFDFEKFTQDRWGFNTIDLVAVMRFVQNCGYDPSTVTEDELAKLMALARLRDHKLDDLPAFYHRVLNKEIRDIDNADLEKLYNLYTGKKLIDPLAAVKKGRTLDTIGIFTGEKLPSGTAVTGADMLSLVRTLREFAKDGGEQTATMVFNGRPLTISQTATGVLLVTINGMRVTGAQSAAGFVHIFEGDMTSNVDRFGAESILRMIPELTAADIADVQGSASRLREICLRIASKKLEIPPSSLATIPTATLRTIAANALKGYYTTETGALNKAAANAILSDNTRNDVFTGEEIRDLHAAMVRTGIEELNRKVVVANRPVQRPVASFDPKVRLAAVQEKARNLLADLIMNGDIVSYDEAIRNGEGGKRILDLLGKNLDTFVDIVTDLDNALAGFAEPMRSTLIDRFKEMTAGLPDASGANMFAKVAMKQVYKAAFAVMLEVSSLHEAERAQAVQSKIKENKALQTAIYTGKITAEDISGAILDMIPQIAGLDRAMDELVGTAMAQIQEMINEKLSANMPDEAEEAAPREEAPIWQQSFDRLVGGALTDSSCGYGKFMNGVLSTYFQNASPQEGRQMLASIFRNTTAESTQGQIVGALFKGAGPLLQKMLQALPADAFGDDMRDALKDMKSNLQPIPEAIVKSHLLDIVNRSAGAIKSIEVVRSLGAASVGQAFLCRMITAEHPTGEEVVVKILRPNVKTIIENERRRFTEAAKSAPGMEKTFEGQYARILEELDFTKEKTNIDFGRSVYEQPTIIYTDGFSGKDRRVVSLNTLHSMEVHPLVPPSMDSLILKKAPGETYDRYMADAREKAREIAGVANPQGYYEFADPGSMTEAKVKLLKLYNEVKTRQDYLLQLTEKWVQEALYGNGFYHGDLHAGNIMTDGRGLTVIDFGNATHLTKAEREHVLKMMSAAMFGREAYFEESFKALISEEGRAVYDARNANGEITKALHEILNKGVTTDTGRRIFAALMHLQRNGIEIPGPIYNFAQCQMRLGGAVDEMNSLLNEIRYSVEQIRLAPIDVPEIPQGAHSVAEGLRAAFNALIGLVNSERGGYEALAANLKPHFGITGTDNDDAFKNVRLPQFIGELKTAFKDRETFDLSLKPVLEYLCGAKCCSVHGDVHRIEMDATASEALKEKLAEFISARDSEDEGAVEEAAGNLAEAFIAAVKACQYSLNANRPDYAGNVDDNAFVGSIANVVSSNVKQAFDSLGYIKSASIYFDMKAVEAKEKSAAKRMEGTAARIDTYVQTCADGAVDAEAVKTIRRISEEFQHPLNMPGTDGKAGSLKGNSEKALFLSTLRFNLDHLESRLRAEGLLTDDTTAEMKTHFARIAMQCFADRVGGIADAVRRLSNSAYANLYDEAYAQEVQEVNSSKLLVRDALVHFRFPTA